LVGVPKRFPEDAESTSQSRCARWIDQPLRSFGVEARIGIGLPAPQFEPQALRGGDATVEFLDHCWQRVALGLDVTW